jgi:hypothetical protein
VSDRPEPPTRRAVLRGGSAALGVGLGIGVVHLPRAAAAASVLTPASESDAAGTPEDPILVAAADDLAWIADDASRWTLHYRQVGNIDLDGAAFTPLALGGTFTGGYRAPRPDGGAYRISGLAIDLGAVNNVGFISRLGSGAVVEDLELEVDGITGRSGVGALVGLSGSGSIVRRVHVSATDGAVVGTATGAADTGGLVGYAVGGTFEDCSAAIDVVSRGRNVGGFAGDCTGGATMRRCLARGDVGPPAGQATLDAAFGGFAGLLRGTVEDCFARGAATASVPGSRDGVGGFAGQLDGGTLRRSYATGTASVTSGGNAARGGLVGDIRSNIDFTVTAAYWDTVTSGLATSAAGVGRSTAELADPAQLDGWDLTTVWAIDAAVNGGYPHLRAIAGR